MKVPYDTEGRTRPSAQPLGYFQGSFPNMQGLLTGLSAGAEAIAQADAKRKQAIADSQRFQANASLLDFEIDSKVRTYNIERDANPLDNTVPERVANDFDTYANEFVNGLPPDLQEEFKLRTAQIGQALKYNSIVNAEDRLIGHQKQQIVGAGEKAKMGISGDHNTLESWRQTVDEMIDSSNMTMAEKEAAKLANAQQLERVAYNKDLQERKARDADTLGHTNYLISRGHATSEFDMADSVSRLNPTFAARLSRALQDAEAATGEKAVITDAFRDETRQARYYADYKAGKGGLAAAPGRSRHQRGNAADISRGKVLTWLHKNAKNYGLEFLSGAAFDKDHVHIQLAGGVTLEPANNNNLFTFKNVTTAMWRVESSNGANVLSPKGAAGITQVMPGTAREIAGELNDTNFPAGGTDEEIQKYLINNPSVSLKYGEHYFNKMLAKYGNDTEVALIAYNGGPGRADAFLAAGRDYSVLPEETAQYVDKVYREMGVPDDIDNNPRYANLPYEDRVALRTDAEAAFQKLMKDREEALNAKGAEARNNLYTGLFDGKYGQQDIDMAREAGVLTKFEDIKKANEILKQRLEATNDLAAFTQRVNAGQTFSMTSTDDKKQANAWFGKEGKAAINSMNQSYVTDTLIPMYNKIGMLPPDLVDQLYGQAYSKNWDQAKFALNTLSLLENANNVAYAGQVSEAMQKRADLWELMNRIYPEDNVREILQGPPTQEQRNARDQLAQLAEKDMQNAEFAYSFKTVLDKYDGYLSWEPNAPGARWAAMGMERDWLALLKQNYIDLGGNWEAANELAGKQIERLWSVSTVGGGKVLMRSAPERAYPALNVDEMTNQLRSELGLTKDENVQLISDTKTDSEIAALSKPRSLVARFSPFAKPTRNPTYQVAVEKDGVWHVLVNETSQPLRFEFSRHPLSGPLEEAKARRDQWRTQVEPHQSQLMDQILPNAPDNLMQEIFEKENQLQKAEDEVFRIEQEMRRSYLTPAQRELETVQQTIKLFQDRVATITTATIPANISEPFANALDREKELQAQVQQEIAERRKYLPR